MDNKIQLTIENKIFNVSLYNNDTSKAFLDMLPLNINMSDLNNNEKYYNISKNLPAKAEKVSSIKKGDIMLYGNNCIVIFYKSFNTPYSYTKIGYIENTDDLTEAMGYGSVSVSFSK